MSRNVCNESWNNETFKRSDPVMKFSKMCQKSVKYVKNCQKWPKFGKIKKIWVIWTEKKTKRSEYVKNDQNLGKFGKYELYSLKEDKRTRKCQIWLTIKTCSLKTAQKYCTKNTPEMFRIWNCKKRGVDWHEIYTFDIMILQ